MENSAERKGREGGLVTIAEALRYLRISRTMYYRLCERGFLHPVKIGDRAVRLHRAEVENLAEKGVSSSE